MPPPQESKLNYNELYPGSYPTPATYIRSSQTVEESIACQYDMAEDDDEFLKSYNEKRPVNSRLSDEDFEKIMEVFEDTAAVQTPFAAVDNTVVPYDMMVQGLNDLDASKVMSHAKEIYEYWKSRRQSTGNRPLHPSLKFETRQEIDDMDPYVCFRRREVRQTRKQRNRDVQVADKLKRLRRELEDGRQLILVAHQRELVKHQLLNVDRLVFEQRAKLKETKIRLGIKADDEDLAPAKVRPVHKGWPDIDNADGTKPQKRKVSEVPAAQRAAGPHARAAVRPDGRVMEADLALLADKLAEKENELRNDIEFKILNHRRWNANHVDLTRDPLSPPTGKTTELSFRPAKTQYLMTPPASASSGSEEPTAMELDQPETGPVFQFRGVSQEESSTALPVFRRRIGRLNRLWIDRRGLPSPPRESSGQYSDRWKYDQDDDDEDEQPVYEVDQFDTRALKFRATIPLPGHLMGVGPTRKHISDATVHGAAQPNGVAPQNRQAIAAPQAQAQPPPS